MKAVIQRVSEASVLVEGEEVSRIGPGLLTLLGVAKGDTEEQLKKLVKKVVELRIFSDAEGKMNKSLLDISGEHLIVSQFTLLGDCRKGRRPHFMGAEDPSRAEQLYEQAIGYSQSLGVVTSGGQFAADMKVQLVNDGPVTFLIET